MATVTHTRTSPALLAPAPLPGHLVAQELHGILLPPSPPRDNTPPPPGPPHGHGPPGPPGPPGPGSGRSSGRTTPSSSSSSGPRNRNEEFMDALLALARAAQNGNGKKTNFVNAPTEFHGKRSDYLEWKRSVDDYVENHPGISTTEPGRSRERIACAKSYMKGPTAGTWAQNHTARERDRTALAPGQYGPPPAPQTWEEFTSSLRPPNRPLHRKSTTSLA